MKTRVREVAGYPVVDGKKRHWFKVTIDENDPATVLWVDGKMLCADHDDFCVCKKAVLDSHIIPAPVAVGA